MFAFEHLLFVFKGDGDLPDGICKTPEELAELIEDAIFRVHKGTTPKYKNQVKFCMREASDQANGQLFRPRIGSS